MERIREKLFLKQIRNEDYELHYKVIKTLNLDMPSKYVIGQVLTKQEVMDFMKIFNEVEIT